MVRIKKHLKFLLLSQYPHLAFCKYFLFNNSLRLVGEKLETQGIDPLYLCHFQVQHQSFRLEISANETCTTENCLNMKLTWYTLTETPFGIWTSKPSSLQLHFNHKKTHVIIRWHMLEGAKKRRERIETNI